VCPRIWETRNAYLTTAPPTLAAPYFSKESVPAFTSPGMSKDAPMTSGPAKANLASKKNFGNPLFFFVFAGSEETTPS
jgi:hypothetical protein